MFSQNLEIFKNTAFLRTFAFAKIPLLSATSPTVLELSPEKIVLEIKLKRKTKNHLGSLYFGALCMGGEAAVGIKAFEIIRQSGKRVDLIFKDFHAEFLKRAEGHAQFICDQGAGIQALVDKCLQSGERESQTFESYAIVPAKTGDEPVAKFSVTLSLKARR